MIITKDDVISINTQITRFVTPKKIRINEAFLNSLLSNGTVTKGEGKPPFDGIPVQIDNTIDSYICDY